MLAFLKSLAERRDVLLLSFIAFMPVSRSFLFVRNRLNRSTGDYATIDFQNSINIVAVALMLGFLLRSKARLSHELMLRGPTQWMLLYFGLCLLSVLWGTSPLYITYQSVELIVVLSFMGYILERIADPHDAVLYLCRFCAATAFLPYLGDVARFGGVIQHTNAFSTCGACGLILILACMRTGVLVLGEVKYSLIGCLVPLVFGTSAASNIAFVTGLILLWSLSPAPRRTISRAVFAMAVVGGVVVTAFGVVMPYLFPDKPMEQILSLHGRIGLWREFLAIGRQQMVLGGGFVVGERSVELWGGEGFGSAHNALVSVFVNTGVVGLVLFVGAWFAILHRTWVCHLWGDPYAYPVLIAMLVGLVNGMSYPLVGSSWRYVTTPFFGIVAYVSVFLNPAYYALREPCLLTDNRCSS
jgi:hypothetical protein